MLMSAPADHIPSSFDAITHTTTLSSNRTSSTRFEKSRIRSRSYVFAFGLFSHATATPSSFWSSMYLNCMAIPSAFPAEPRDGLKPIPFSRPMGGPPGTFIVAVPNCWREGERMDGVGVRRRLVTACAVASWVLLSITALPTPDDRSAPPAALDGLWSEDFGDCSLDRVYTAYDDHDSGSSANYGDIVDVVVVRSTCAVRVRAVSD